MFCAALAGQRGRRVLLIDHSPEPGRKILISGGGRCNFTNVGASADNFLSANPHFAKSALGRFTPEDFIALVDRHRIAWHEKTLGQLFCDGSSKQIVAMLLGECAAGAVETAFGQAVTVEHRNGAWICDGVAALGAVPALAHSPSWAAARVRVEDLQVTAADAPIPGDSLGLPAIKRCCSSPNAASRRLATLRVS